MRNDDPRIRELFTHVRQAASILEEPLLRPLPAPDPRPTIETKVRLDPPVPTMPQNSHTRSKRSTSSSAPAGQQFIRRSEKEDCEP
jgi:hypothetical protein